MNLTRSVTSKVVYAGHEGRLDHRRYLHPTQASTLVHLGHCASQQSMKGVHRQLRFNIASKLHGSFEGSQKQCGCCAPLQQTGTGANISCIWKVRCLYSILQSRQSSQIVWAVSLVRSIRHATAAALLAILAAPLSLSWLALEVIASSTCFTPTWWSLSLPLPCCESAVQGKCCSGLHPSV